MSVSQSNGDHSLLRPSAAPEERVTETKRRVVRQYTIVGDTSTAERTTAFAATNEIRRPVQMTESYVLPTPAFKSQSTYPVAADPEFLEVQKSAFPAKDFRSPQPAVSRLAQMTPQVGRGEPPVDYSFKSERKDAESVPNTYNMNVRLTRGERSSSKAEFFQRTNEAFSSSRVLPTAFDRPALPVSQSVRGIATFDTLDGDFGAFEREVGLSREGRREVARLAPEQVADSQSNRSDYVLYEDSRTVPIDRNARWVNSIPNAVGDNRGARGSHPHLPFGEPAGQQFSKQSAGPLYQDFATASNYQRQTPVQQDFRLSQEQWEANRRNSRPASRGEALVNGSQYRPASRGHVLSYAQEPSTVITTVTTVVHSGSRPGSRGASKQHNIASLPVTINDDSADLRYLSHQIHQNSHQGQFELHRPASAHQQQFREGPRGTDDSSLSVPFTDLHEAYAPNATYTNDAGFAPFETVKRAANAAAVPGFETAGGLKFLKFEEVGGAAHEKVELVLEGVGRYTGGMRHGQLDGYGILSTADGRSILYEGEFEENHFNGVGVMYNDPSATNAPAAEFAGQLPDNWTRFEGLFLKSRREGFGELFFKDGSHYSGEFANDKANGHGTFTERTGRKHQGLWKDNRQAVQQ